MMDAEAIRKPLRASKHINRACIPCRQRKTKCDGARPQCANCRLHGQICRMPQELDKRKIPFKDRFTRLERYTQSLESLILASGLQIPTQDGDSHSPHERPMMVPRSTPSSSTGDSRRRPDVNLGHGPPTTQMDDNTGSRVVGVDAQDDVDILSERFGSLQVAEDGQLRFFGATSNLHISHVGPFPLIDSQIQSIHGKERNILRHASVDHEVDDKLENHLIRLYFCWENPNIPVVDENIFYRERDAYRSTGQPSHKYSEVLTNAMCAVGAALTTRFCPGLPEPLVDFFARRAIALLDIELDCPTLCTIQSLVILSGVEAIRTKDARGWLYSGMAMRLSTDLGLHLNSGSMGDQVPWDIEEVKLRNIVFCGAFIHDRMWSFYVGRPESLDQKHISGDFPTPANLMRNDPQFWKPYIDDHQSSVVSAMPSLFSEVMQHTVTLCAQMSDIRRDLYSTPMNEANIKSLYTLARQIKLRLSSWLAGLPKALTLNLAETQSPKQPHILQLHMQYHAIKVIIERPFLSGASSRNTTSGLTLKEVEESRTACDDAAAAIAQILQLFRRQYSLSRMNIHTVHLVFTASVVHVYNVYFASTQEVRNSAQRYLQICCQGLYDIGRGYRNALRALEIVTCIKSDLGRRRHHHHHHHHRQQPRRLTTPTTSNVGPHGLDYHRPWPSPQTTTVEQSLSVDDHDHSRLTTLGNAFDFVDGEGSDLLPQASLLTGETLFAETESWRWPSPTDPLFRNP